MKTEGKIKIAHVVVASELAGAQQIALDILSNISNENVEKYIICGELHSRSADFISLFENANVSIISVPELKRNIGKSDIAAFSILYKIFKEYKFDIVHTNSTKPAIVARTAAKIAGIKKVIHTVHGIAFHKKVSQPLRTMYWAIEYFSALFGDFNISVNNYYKRFYPLIKTPVIHNGINFNNFHLNKYEKDFINFAFMARLDDQKNPLEFLMAAKLAIKTYKGNQKIRFTLAGDGPLMSDCLEYINSNGMDQHVDVKGWVSNKSDFYNGIDVLCQPSEWEAFGLVFVEAAYFEVPSIGKAVEGVPEVIDSSRTGFTYNGGEKDMCDLMLRYIENPSLIKEHGKAAKNNALEKFSIEIMVKKYKEIYDLS
ncbi:glycosyltransferase [Enterobacter hormaechei]|uniref:glycosyltransferase n=1 Tax=Enterobacter hormaechei TaxID=158836 RepID=UPI001BD26EE1|nr:glycosyltransferase [Enterobacter hormaechei]EMB6145871.1 glycosyltransferase [Enterobacter asburiae]MCE1967830.1 glycosyltransferase [Enterobacter hormaechei]MDP0434415.1 glycosyltransferase [Enterobacter hormaechei]DAF76676.1 MAG TPA: CapM-like protein [Caudoviricetes sp.]